MVLRDGCCYFWCVLVLVVTFGLDLVVLTAEIPQSSISTICECQSDSLSSGRGLSSRGQSPMIKIQFGLEYNFTQYIFRFQKNTQPLGCFQEPKFQKIQIPLKLENEVEVDHSSNGQMKVVVLSQTNTQVKIRRVSFLSSGQLRLGNGLGLSVFYKPQEYCIQKINSTHTEFQICTSHCSNPDQNSLRNNDGNEKEICIQKCCPPESTFSFHKSKTLAYARSADPCQPSAGEKIWKPTFWDSQKFQDEKSTLAMVEKDKEPMFRIVWNQKRNCKKSLYQPRRKIKLHEDEEIPAFGWRLLDNGSLIIMNGSLEDADSEAEVTLDLTQFDNTLEILDIHRHWQLLHKRYSFCIDGIHDFGGEELYAGHHRYSHQFVHVCYDNLENTNLPKITTITTPTSTSNYSTSTSSLLNNSNNINYFALITLLFFAGSVLQVN